MRAHQIMTRPVVTVMPDAPSSRPQTSCCDIISAGFRWSTPAGKLVGIVSEGDFIRRSEIGTQRKRSRLLKLILGPGQAATDFVHEHGCKIAEIMTHGSGDDHRGYLARSDRGADGEEQTQAVAGDARRKDGRHRVARQSAAGGREPCARDSRPDGRRRSHPQPHHRCARQERLVSPGLSVVVRDGIVHLGGIITDERSRQAAIVCAENIAGVKKVHDHLCWVDPMSGLYFIAPEDEESRKRVRLGPSQPISRLFPSDTRRAPARTGAAHACDLIFLVERAGAAERNRAGMAENLPLPLPSGSRAPDFRNYTSGLRQDGRRRDRRPMPGSR